MIIIMFLMPEKNIVSKLTVILRIYEAWIFHMQKIKKIEINKRQGSCTLMYGR